MLKMIQWVLLVVFVLLDLIGALKSFQTFGRPRLSTALLSGIRPSNSRSYNAGNPNSKNIRAIVANIRESREPRQKQTVIGQISKPLGNKGFDSAKSASSSAPTASYRSSGFSRGRRSGVGSKGKSLSSNDPLVNCPQSCHSN